MTFSAIQKPEKHPAASIFERYGVSKTDIAATVGKTYNFTCGVLNGRFNPSPETDLKIRELAAAVEAEAAGKTVKTKKGENE